MNLRSKDKCVSKRVILMSLMDVEVMAPKQQP